MAEPRATSGAVRREGTPGAGRTRWPWLATLLVSCGLLWLGTLGGPVPDQDASYFLGGAVNLANGNGLTNRLDGILVAQDPEGLARLAAYPPVFPLLLGELHVSDISRAYMAMALLAVVTLVGLTLFLDRPASLGGAVGRWTQAAAIVGLGSAFANGAFRPEAVSTPLVLLFAGGALSLPASPRRDLLLGALAGVTAHVQAPIALYQALIWMTIASRTERPRALARRSLHFGAAMVGALVAGASLHPYGASVYVRSFLRFSSSVLAMQHPESWLEYWVFGVRFPGLIFPLALATSVAVACAGRLRQTWATPAALAVAAVAGATLLVRNTMMVPTRWYEAAVFMPLVYRALLSWTSDRELLPSRWRVAAARAALLLIGVNATGIVGRLVQGAAQQHMGTTIHAAAFALNAEVALRGGHGIIGVEAPLGFLLRRPERGCLVERERATVNSRTCDVRPRLVVTFEGRQEAVAERRASSLRGGDGAGVAAAEGRWHLACEFLGTSGRVPATSFDALGRGWTFAVYERAGPGDVARDPLWAGTVEGRSAARPVPQCARG